MPAPSGPRCPGCGYPIFGLRDLRCPECGRALDVRDFNIDLEDSEAHQRRLRRHGRIGVLGGSLVLLVCLGLVVLVAGAFMQAGAAPPLLIILLLVAFAIWLGRVLLWAGREELSDRRRKR